MPTKYCCPECFDDRGLRSEIFPFRGAQIGNCDYCDTNSVLVLDPKELTEYFQMVANIYRPDDIGKTLVEWMKEDWSLFSHPKMDISHSAELLADILDDGDIVRRRYVPWDDFRTDVFGRWTDLRDEMMHEFRWFFRETIDVEQLGKLLDHVATADLQEKWFRSRIQTDHDAFHIDKMGAPPKRRATNGRANPAGIPYLYLGSSPETAAVEVRPHTGEVACVASFTVPRIKAVDLRNPRKFVSPFYLYDASQVGELRAGLPFLERLGDELTRPVLPSGADIDYIPSQYLCEFIKSKEFDGVVYGSSVSEGFNLVLFDPSKAIPGEVSVYDINKVSIEVSAR